MKVRFCILPLLTLLAVGTWELAQGEVTSPYTFVCEDKRCLRKLKSAVNGTGMTLDVCKLNCDDLGTLWPLPTGEAALGKELVSLYPSAISVNADDTPAEIKEMVNKAFEIFKTYLKNPTEGNDEEVQKHELKVVLKATSASTDIDLTQDESYNLTVATTTESDKTIVTATVTAVTFFGLRHGLETLSQVIAYDEVNDALQVISSVNITDKPVFAYRGIMLDTSRNYYSMEKLKRLIDGMSYNKMTVFHWHITDTHSFPMEVPKRPKMMQYGAYSADKVYTQENIKNLVDYAKQRGVKIIPEIDQPAHSGYGYQWGKEDGLGDLVVCVESEPWYDYCVEPPCGQYNIVNENVTEVAGDIVESVFDVFDNDIFHMGGDEVDFRCYNSTPEVTEWMSANNYSLDADGFYRLWGRFQDQMLEKVYQKSAKQNATKVIMWTSGLTHPERIEQYLDKNKYIIQIWTESTDPVIGGLLQKGYKVVFSNVDALYLDCGFPAWLGNGHNWCAPIKGWQTVYDNDPQKIYSRWTNESTGEEAVRNGQIMGGEAPLWSEQSDDATLETRVWPRAAAHAERLWTHPKTTYAEAEYRMVANRNRMAARGLDVDRLQPEFCLQMEGKCYAEAPGTKSAASSTYSSTPILTFFFIAIANAIN